MSRVVKYQIVICAQLTCVRAVFFCVAHHFLFFLSFPKYVSLKDEGETIRAL
jgi:hypothetical protein